AVLLGQQLALQPVGEARDHVRQARELLVEIGAQPRQLLGVAQLLGGDDLVVGGGEDLVGHDPAFALQVGARRLVAFAHVGGLVRLVGVGIVLRLHHLTVGVLAVALARLVLVQGGLLRGLALAVAVVVVV